MTDDAFDLIAAGHISLDITPRFPASCAGRGFEQVLRPGSLVVMDPATVSSGGGAANVGLAALRLGLRACMMGKCGDDLLGRTLLEVLRRSSPAAAEGMRVVAGEHTSYSVVLALPGLDRMFLHCPGANDTFEAADVDLDLVARGRVFYFGYPPLMARMYAGGGEELAALLAAVKARGATTCLDMALPDPSGSAGAADWPGILAAALPHADIFAPSVEELAFMLRRQAYDRLVAAGDVLDRLDAGLLRGLAAECLRLGAGAVVIKCGRHGLYARGAGEGRIAAMGAAAPEAAGWADVELFAPACRVAQIVSAAGAGDSAVAGLLGGLLRGADLKTACDYACAVGAQNLRALDTTSGVGTWEEATAMLTAPRVAPGVEL